MQMTCIPSPVQVSLLQNNIMVENVKTVVETRITSYSLQRRFALREGKVYGTVYWEECIWEY